MNEVNYTMEVRGVDVTDTGITLAELWTYSLQTGDSIQVSNGRVLIPLPVEVYR